MPSFHHFFHISDWENGLSIWGDVCFESPVKAIYGIWHEASCPFAYSFTMISDLSKHWSLGYPVAFCKQLIVTYSDSIQEVQVCLCWFLGGWLWFMRSSCMFIYIIYLFIYSFMYFYFSHIHIQCIINIYNILWLPYWMEYTLTFNSSHIECHTCPGRFFFVGPPLCEGYAKSRWATPDFLPVKMANCWYLCLSSGVYSQFLSRFG